MGIAGAVGSGKSSLMSAILGEMRRLTGEVSVRGRLAYVSQQGRKLPLELLFNLKLNIQF